MDGFFDGDIFIYRGGRAPQHITHARIDKSVDEIEEGAFRYCEYLEQVDTHDGIKRVGKNAFCYCKSLRRINLKSVVEIEDYAFYYFGNLESVEFGNRLETIVNCAFGHCASLKTPLRLPSIVTIGHSAFIDCTYLTTIELSERLETIEVSAFKCCYDLQRIVIPLKRDLFEFDDDVSDLQHYSQFDECFQLTTVDLVGGVHKTVASLHMESWRTEMIAEINRINQVLPGTCPFVEKTDAIREWMDSVIDKMDHYKAEHHRYVKEGITILELALWKARLGEKEDNYVDSSEGKAKNANVDAVTESARKEKRITCGADIVIKNVLPFLMFYEGGLGGLVDRE